MGCGKSKAAAASTHKDDLRTAGTNGTVTQEIHEPAQAGFTNGDDHCLFQSHSEDFQSADLEEFPKDSVPRGVTGKHFHCTLVGGSVPKPKAVGNEPPDTAELDNAAEASKSAVAPMDEDTTTKLEEYFNAATKACREKLAGGSIFEAEKILMDSLASFDIDTLAPEVRRAKLEEYSERLRQTNEYSETLALLRSYEEGVAFAVETVDPAAGWLLAAEVPVDYPALGMELSPEADVAITKDIRVINIYWRKCPSGRIEVRIAVILPTRPANVKQTLSCLHAWIAMNAETELFSTWHPIVAGNGPIELEARGNHFNLWHLCVKIMFLKLVSLQKERMLFNHETGSHVLLVNDLPETDPLWEKHPPPKGFKQDPDCSDLTAAFICQEHTCFMAVGIATEFKSPPPTWIVKLMIEWVIPEMVRRLLKSSMRCLKEDGAYFPIITADKDGLYAETARLVDAAPEHDRSRDGSNVVYSPKKFPPPESLSSRARSLTKLEATKPALTPAKAA